MQLRQIVLLCCGVLAAEGRLTKVWSVTGAVNSGASVVNISDSLVIPYHARRSRAMNIVTPNQYFRPRAIPLSEQPQIYYTPDKYKSEILFPGNFTIATEKSDESSVEDPAYNPLNAEPFRPRTIPLMRGQAFQSRSLDEDSGEEDEEEPTASRRSLAYVLGVEDEENEDDEEGDEDIEEEGEETHYSKAKLKPGKLKKAQKKYSKYLMPLLLAYKLKYFALVPVLISGLILLVGATGMAGFFFALFAAVMGLQKGSY